MSLGRINKAQEAILLRHIFIKKILGWPKKPEVITLYFYFHYVRHPGLQAILG